MKVMLNYEAIHRSFTPAKRFENFLLANRDTVFTAKEFLRTHQGGVFYSLEENDEWIINGLFLTILEED